MALKKLKLRTKFNVFIIVNILVLSVVIGVVSALQINKLMSLEYEDRVKVEADLAYRWIDDKYPGEWNIQDGELYKGEVKINNNHAILDQLVSITGGDSSIFLGDTRIATSLMDENGNRSVGTKVDTVVEEAVLINHGTYIGEVDVIGEKYIGSYIPITDAKGDIIGIMSYAIPINMIQEMLMSVILAIAITIIVAGVIIAINSVLFTNSVVRPINIVNKQLQQIAEGEGDLTQEIHVKSKDEIGQMAEAFNKTMSTLRTMLRQVRQTSDQVALSSEDLLASAEQTASSTNQVVLSIQEVANTVDIQDKNTAESVTAINEITRGIQHIASSITTVAETANETMLQANKGNEYIQKVVGQVNHIYQSSSETIDVMTKLEQRSQEIGRIIDVITGIAEQTNLLALNAAIEAARAGEFGRGFAVVADEVRKLAEQSRQSAVQIVELIKVIQEDTTAAVEKSNVGNSLAKEGLILAEETGKSFENILYAVENVRSQTQELSAVAEQISASVEQVNSSIEEIARLAKTNSVHATEIASSSEEQLATMEEVTASANTLQNMAEQLRELVNRFKV